MTKTKIVGMEEALASIPAEERNGLRQGILDAFEEAAKTGKLPGKPIERLPDGTRACPACGAVLKRPHTFRFPEHAGGDFAGQLVTCFECRPCNAHYMVRAMQ
jgi:hypothetical protein